MEKLRKVFAFVLALVISAGMGVTAFADEALLGKGKLPEVKIKIAGEGKGSVTLTCGDGKTFTVTDESDRKEGSIALAEGTEIILSIEADKDSFVKKADGDIPLEETFVMGKKGAEVTVTFSEKIKEKKDSVLTVKNSTLCVGKSTELTVSVNTHGKGWIAEKAEIFEKTADGGIKLGEAVLKEDTATFTLDGKTKAEGGAYYAIVTYKQKNTAEHNHYEAFITNEVSAEWIEHRWDDGTLDEEKNVVVHHCENEGCEETVETQYTKPEPDPETKPDPDPETKPDPKPQKDKDSTAIIIGEKDDDSKKDDKEKNPHTGAPVLDMGAVILAVSAAFIAVKIKKRG